MAEKDGRSVQMNRHVDTSSRGDIIRRWRSSSSSSSLFIQLLRDVILNSVHSHRHLCVITLKYSID